MTAERLALGASGEALVAAWYEAQGYTVLARNWKVRAGELDVIAQRGRIVVFCEVKSRSTLDWGSPAEAVHDEKRRRIRHLAALWLETDAPRRPAEIRFDVATVVGADVEVIEGAF
jgi:putative endonuclease